MMEVGQVWYNPNGYFALKVQSVDGGKVVMYSPNDDRDFPRELDVEEVVNNWVKLK